VSPDRASKRAAARKRAAPVEVKTKPSSDDPHEIVYFKRHKKDDPNETIPAREFLQNVCPPGVRAKLNAILVAVAAAPPKRFAGGGKWEAMKESMTGWFEARADGPQRHHYRLYCRLDYEAKGRDKPLLTVVAGLDKPFRTELSEADYKAVRDLGDEYFFRNPRSVA
jgi:hypothetical protein